MDCCSWAWQKPNSELASVQRGFLGSHFPGGWGSLWLKVWQGSDAHTLSSELGLILFVSPQRFPPCWLHFPTGSPLLVAGCVTSYSNCGRDGHEIEWTCLSVLPWTGPIQGGCVALGRRVWVTCLSQEAHGSLHHRPHGLIRDMVPPPQIQGPTTRKIVSGCWVDTNVTFLLYSQSPASFPGQGPTQWLDPAPSSLGASQMQSGLNSA